LGIGGLLTCLHHWIVISVTVEDAVEPQSRHHLRKYATRSREKYTKQILKIFLSFRLTAGCPLCEHREKVSLEGFIADAGKFYAKAPALERFHEEGRQRDTEGRHK